ncbi:hypothetical protein NDU88_006170 [Pleurodeles waltl]|uniref:Uncharacterized protein n=1 Tax=Pleurodeles waltl TaxID=8319 RepID=A0AAV7VL55_PLEWA|nr:hypothetical protein NDU88_006170 [Pleurodeles waltl]
MILPPWAPTNPADGAVQLQRHSYAGVKRKLKDLGYTYMLLYPAKLKVLHAGHSHSPEAAWDCLVRNDGTGTPESLRWGSGKRLRETVELCTAVHRRSRRHCAGRGSQVIVCSDGTLSLERRRQEHEEAKLLVQTVTSEVSSRSGSPGVTSGLSPEGEVEAT